MVERHEETSARLPKLVYASAAPSHLIHLSMTSQIERDIMLNLCTLELTYECLFLVVHACAFDRGTVLDPVCSNRGVIESNDIASRGPSSIIHVRL